MSDQRESVLDGAYACVSRFGMGKTTIDDVAKASGVSRATIYRLFPGGREEVLRQTVGAEMNRFFVRLADAVADAPDLASRLEEALVFARRSLLDHEVLQKVLVTEPDLLLPLMTVEQHRVLRFITAYLEPLLAQERAAGRVRDDIHPDDAADYLARMVLSLIGSPGRWDLTDREAVRRLVADELLAGVRRPSEAPDGIE